jgi:hypothetical protein
MRKSFVLYALFPLLAACLFAQQTIQPTSTATAQPSDEDHILDDGTPVKLGLIQELSSANATPGQLISFQVMDDIEVDGVTVLRRGTVVTGTVTDAEAKRRMGRAGRLSFNIDIMSLADNEKVHLRGSRSSSGESHTEGMLAVMENAPAVSAPFFLLMHGEDTIYPKGTVITVFIDGDMRLDLSKFQTDHAATAPALPSPNAVVTHAKLTIDSSPSGAEIQIDGTAAGNTPSTVDVTSGSHQIVVKQKGCEPWIKTIAVTGGTIRIHAELEQSVAR